MLKNVHNNLLKIVIEQPQPRELNMKKCNFLIGTRKGRKKRGSLYKGTNFREQLSILGLRRRIKKFKVLKLKRLERKSWSAERQPRPLSKEWWAGSRNLSKRHQLPGTQVSQGTPGSFVSFGKTTGQIQISLSEETATAKIFCQDGSQGSRLKQQEASGKI